MSDEEETSVSVLGKDISSIPCMRSSLLTGLGGGIGVGLIYFLSTSKPKRACDIAVVSFTGITLSSWCYCRYKWSERKFNMHMLKSVMKDQLLFEGTDKESVHQTPKSS